MCSNANFPLALGHLVLHFTLPAGGAEPVLGRFPPPPPGPLAGGRVQAGTGTCTCLVRYRLAAFSLISHLALHVHQEHQHLASRAFAQLSNALASDEARHTFEAALSEDGTVPGTELQLGKVVTTFKASTSLVEQVMLVLDRSAQRSRGGATCALPSVGPAFLGRDEDVEELCDMFNSSRAVCVVGEGGLGKSSVALAVGWKLWKQWKQRKVAGTWNAGRVAQRRVTLALAWAGASSAPHRILAA